jgi:hypothetical protein
VVLDHRYMTCCCLARGLIADLFLAFESKVTRMLIAQTSVKVEFPQCICNSSDHNRICRGTRKVGVGFTRGVGKSSGDQYAPTTSFPFYTNPSTHPHTNTVVQVVDQDSRKDKLAYWNLRLRIYLSLDMWGHRDIFVFEVVFGIRMFGIWSY